MAPPTKKKKTEEDTSTKATSALPYTPEALLALMGKQQIQKDAWNPSVLNLASSAVPMVQTQLAGTQYYDTSPNQFIAPGYEHLRELANKKDLEGKQNKTAWDNFISNVDKFQVDNDPTHQQLMQNVKGSIAEHSDKLRKGLWSENNGLITEFVNDVTTKKGLGSLMSAYAERAAKQEEVTELTKEYDPETQTGGIAPYHAEYAKNRVGYVTPVKLDEEGNIVSHPKFVANQIHTARNIPAEVGKLLDKVKSDSRYVTNKDGSLSFTSLPPELYKYGITKLEYNNENELKQAVADALLVTGGNEYLKFDANAAAYEEMKTATPEMLRERLAEMDKAADGKNEVVKKLLELGDAELMARGEDILGSYEYGKRKNAVLNGAANIYGFTKEELTLVDDFEGMENLKSSLKIKEAKEAEETLGDNAVQRYIVTGSTKSVVEITNPANARSINSRMTEITKTLPILQKNLAELEAKPEYANLPHHSTLKGEIESMQNELKNLENNAKTIIKGYGDYIRSKHNISFNDIYVKDYVPNIKDKSQIKDRDYFFQALTAAIAAESDNDSGTTAEKELTKAGIPLGIITDRKGGLGDYNNTDRVIGSSFTMGTSGGTATTNYNKNLLNFASSIGRSIKKDYENNKDSDFYKKYNLVPKIQTDITTINAPIGASASDIEASNMVAAFKDISKKGVENIESVYIFDPSGKSKITPSAALQEEFGLKSGEMSKLFYMDADNSEVVPTTTQTYGEKSGLVYQLRLKLRPEENMDSRLKKLREKVIKQIGDNQFYERRIMLGDNQESSDRLVADALRAVYLRGEIDRTVIPDIIKQQLAITYGNAKGISSAIDKAKLDGMQHNQTRLIKFNNQDFHITALTIPGGDKVFTIQGVENGVKKWLAFDENGNPGYYTANELDNNRKLEKKVFDTDLDVKAFFSQGYLDLERANSNFNRATNNSRENVASKQIIAYRPTNLIQNPQKVSIIINNYSNGKSPLTANDYIKVSKDTGVPIDLLLAQGIQESNFGTKGRAVRTKNVGNVGNTDSGAAEYKDSWLQGLYRQAILLKEEYGVQSTNDVQRLLNTRFKRPKGGHYASDINYHYNISKILDDLHKISVS